jgi:hypothetical protein
VRLSRDKTIRLSHLILNYMNQDEDVEFFADPQQIRQHIIHLISEEMKVDEAIEPWAARSSQRPSWRAPTSDGLGYFEEEAQAPQGDAAESRPPGFAKYARSPGRRPAARGHGAPRNHAV